MARTENRFDTTTVAYLLEQLGPSLLAVTAGTRDRKIVDNWLDGSVTPSPDEVERLEIAREIFTKVAEFESPAIARAWFIGRNTGEDETAPAFAIAQDRFDEVRASADSLVTDGWS